MSLILQGIDMPRTGEVTRIEIEDDGTVWAENEREYRKLDESAIQIPKGHGKIGDLDALAEEIREKDIMGGLNYERYIKDVPTILGEEKE